MKLVDPSDGILYCTFVRKNPPFLRSCSAMPRAVSANSYKTIFMKAHCGVCMCVSVSDVSKYLKRKTTNHQPKMINLVIAYEDESDQPHTHTHREREREREQ